MNTRVENERAKLYILYQNKTKSSIPGMILLFFFNGVHYWASEASPTLGCSIEISHEIYMSVDMSVVGQNA